MFWVYKLIKVSILKVTNLLGIMKETLYIIIYKEWVYLYTQKHKFFIVSLIIFYSCKCNCGQQAFSMDDSSTPLILTSLPLKSSGC